MSDTKEVVAIWLCNHYGLVNWDSMTEDFRNTWRSEAGQLLSNIPDKCNSCGLLKSLDEALNSGDGAYRP